jgi:hypothetical protein
LTNFSPIISCIVSDCTSTLEAQWEKPVSLTFHSALRRLNTCRIIDPEWDYLKICIFIIGIKQMYTMKSKTFSLVQLSNRINDNNIVLICSCFPQIVISWSIVISQSGFILVTVFLLPWTEINCV